MDLTSLFKLSYGLYIVSSTDGEKHGGCIVNTVTQVTAEPVKLVVAVHKDNVTTSMIEKSGKFCVCVLNETAPMELIGRFGFKTSRDIDKFDGIEYKVDKNGLYYPAQEVAAVVSCNVLEKVDLGTHILFVAQVCDAFTVNDQPVLTYAYYHSVKKGRTPPKASSYQKPQKKSGFKCTVCGYIYEGDTLPEDYVCPVCGVAANMFEKL